MLVVALLSLLALTAAHSDSDGGAGRKRRTVGDLQPAAAIVSVQYTDREGNLKAAFRYHLAFQFYGLSCPRTFYVNYVITECSQRRFVETQRKYF